MTRRLLPRQVTVSPVPPSNLRLPAAVYGCDRGAWMVGREVTVIRADRELLAELMSVNDTVAAVTLAMLDGTFSRQQHADFGARLVALGHALSARGHQLPAVVIDGSVV